MHGFKELRFNVGPSLFYWVQMPIFLTLVQDDSSAGFRTLFFLSIDLSWKWTNLTQQRGTLTLIRSSSKLGTRQGRNLFTLAYQTRVPRRWFSTCVASPSWGGHPCSSINRSWRTWEKNRIIPTYCSPSLTKTRLVCEKMSYSL